MARENIAAADREPGSLLAIQKAGGLRALAREIGMSAQAFSEWKRVPADRILQVEAITGIPREKLRPGSLSEQIWTAVCLLLIVRRDNLLLSAR